MHNKFRQGIASTTRRKIMPIQVNEWHGIHLIFSLFQAIPENYFGIRHVQIPNPTRDVYKPRAPHVIQYFQLKLQHLLEEYKRGPEKVKILIYQFSSIEF
jgi:hypothetical protein